jgi:phenylacetate-CoA oxygenase PaaH subunit
VSMGTGIFEVFAETEAPRQVVHVGSVRAPNRALAMQWAREIYFRREECLRLGVVEREHLHWSDAPEQALTERNAARSYRTPAFFGRRRRRQAGARTS